MLSTVVAQSLSWQIDQWTQSWASVAVPTSIVDVAVVDPVDDTVVVPVDTPAPVDAAVVDPVDDTVVVPVDIPAPVDVAAVDPVISNDEPVDVSPAFASGDLIVDEWVIIDDVVQAVWAVCGDGILDINEQCEWWPWCVQDVCVIDTPSCGIEWVMSGWMMNIEYNLLESSVFATPLTISLSGAGWNYTEIQRPFPDDIAFEIPTPGTYTLQMNVQNTNPGLFHLYEQIPVHTCWVDLTVSPTVNASNTVFSWLVEELPGIADDIAPAPPVEDIVVTWTVAEADILPVDENPSPEAALVWVTDPVDETQLPGDTAFTWVVDPIAGPIEDPIDEIVAEEASTWAVDESIDQPLDELLWGEAITWVDESIDSSVSVDPVLPEIIDEPIEELLSWSELIDSVGEEVATTNDVWTWTDTTSWSLLDAMLWGAVWTGST